MDWTRYCNHLYSQYKYINTKYHHTKNKIIMRTSKNQSHTCISEVIWISHICNENVKISYLWFKAIFYFIKCFINIIWNLLTQQFNRFYCFNEVYIFKISVSQHSNFTLNLIHSFSHSAIKLISILVFVNLVRKITDLQNQLKMNQS